MIAFGPVPSRRLGYSLGINHVPPKHCSYSCVYCQVGRTSSLETTRRKFYPLERILHEAEIKIVESVKTGNKIDYLTLVPDGEPTLDINLGKLIEGLKSFGIPVAVISNASLIDQNDIQSELLQADWVSLKVDAVEESVWRKINRPHRRLSLAAILQGVHDFRSMYMGELVTETMLVSAINDRQTDIRKLCAFLLELKPAKSYLSIPTRPPAENWVKVPSAESLATILETFSEKVPFMDLLFEEESGDFISTGNISEDILGITSVHPMRANALRRMVARAGANFTVVEDLLAGGEITSINYREEVFFFRNFHD